MVVGVTAEEGVVGIADTEDEEASCSNTCGAGAANVSSVGSEYSCPVVAFPPQQAHRPFVAL